MDWVNSNCLHKFQIIYGFKTADGHEYYVPSGIKVIAITPTGVKLRYKYGDIETISKNAIFKVKRRY